MNTSRRNFIRKYATGLAGVGLLGTSAFASGNLRKVAANEKINLGLIGCKGMGWSNMSAFFNNPEVQCLALADVDQSVLDERAAGVVSARGNTPRLFKDYRKLLEMKELDAVIVATPDHWHCLPFIDALSAGKHVFVEKPLANSIEECNVMVRAAQRYGKVTQTGQWQRSGSHYQKAIDYLRTGALGKVRLVKCWSYQGWKQPIPIVPDSAAPPGVDYDMWLGPAPKRPFNQNRFHFNFRWFWDYAGGLMTDWGVHEIDIALWGMNAKAPKSVLASGGKHAYPDDAGETPDTMQAVYEYDGFNLLWEHAKGINQGNYGKTEGIAFIGNNGTLVVNRQGWQVMPETESGDDGSIKYKITDIPDQPSGANALVEHCKNFLEAIRSNDPSKTRCSAATGAISAINSHMGNIAYKTGRRLYWDESKGTFKADAEANALLASKYYNGWKLPVI
jgi:predicted dehydrogenase